MAAALADLPQLAHLSLQLTRPTIAGLAGVVLLLTLLWSASGKKQRFPPGPKSLPLIGKFVQLGCRFYVLIIDKGNLHQLPKEHHWLYYKELQKKYGMSVSCISVNICLTLERSGDIVHLKLGTNHVILLSKPEYVHELVRPHLPHTSC